MPFLRQAQDDRELRLRSFDELRMLGPFDELSSEVMSRIAAPMVGGMISSTVLTLAVIPAIYALVKQWRLKRGMEG